MSLMRLISGAGALAGLYYYQKNRSNRLGDLRVPFEAGKVSGKLGYGLGQVGGYLRGLLDSAKHKKQY